MNTEKIKNECKALNSSQILNYLKENHLDSQHWFDYDSSESSNTIFHHLFLKDYELSSIILKAFYPTLDKINSHSVNYNSEKPCFIENYFKEVSKGKQLVNILAEQLNAAHYYPEKQLEVIGYFAKGYNKILDYTVGISRNTLSFHDSFLPNLSKDPQNIKTHEIIRKINNTCYMADNTISVFLHYLERPEIIAYKNQSSWHNLIAHIPLISVFCKLHKIANFDLQPDSDDRFERMKEVLLKRIVDKGIVLNQEEQLIFNELRNAHYEPYQHEYTIYLPSDAKICQPFQSLNEVVGFSHIKKYYYEQIEQAYLDNKLTTTSHVATQKQKI